MITNKKELAFYIAADSIMNEQHFPQTWWKKILMPSVIQKFLIALRHSEYYKNKKKTMFDYIPYLYWRRRYENLSVKTGFEIPLNCIGYGVRIGHHTNIVISGAAKIGNYCCLQNNITIGDGKSSHMDQYTIGNNCYISSNVCICRRLIIADGTQISANSLVNKDIEIENQLWGGVPARFIKEKRPWTDGEPYRSEVLKCEELKKKMGL